MEEKDYYYETTHLGKQLKEYNQWDFDFNGFIWLKSILLFVLIFFICDLVQLPDDYSTPISFGVAIIYLSFKVFIFRKVVYENGVGCWKLNKLQTWLPWETCTKVIFENDDETLRTNRYRWYKKRYFATMMFPNQKPIKIEYSELAFLVADWKQLIELNPVLEKKIKFSSLTIKERQEMQRLGFNYHSNI